MSQNPPQAQQDLDPNSTVFLVPWLKSARNSMIREGDAWILRQELTPTQRTAIGNLISSMRSRLACGPSDAKARLVELAKLMAAFPAFQDGEIQTKLRMEAYASSLDGIPAWAVAEAREAIIKGQFGSIKYVPSPAEFASACRARMRLIESDHADLSRIYGAKVIAFEPSPEERQRVSEGFKALRKQLGSQQQDVSRETALDALRQRCIDNGLPLSAIDNVPDAPERTGAFGRIPTSLNRAEEAA